MPRSERWQPHRRYLWPTSPRHAQQAGVGIVHHAIEVAVTQSQRAARDGGLLPCLSSQHNDRRRKYQQRESDLAALLSDAESKRDEIGLHAAFDSVFE